MKFEKQLHHNIPRRSCSTFSSSHARVYRVGTYTQTRYSSTAADAEVIHYAVQRDSAFGWAQSSWNNRRHSFRLLHQETILQIPKAVSQVQVSFVTRFQNSTNSIGD